MSQFFDHGDLRLIVLKLIADQPSHGYELIKAVQTTAGGAYAPSPGVVYPTLTLLNEMGYVSAASADGKTLYTISDEGLTFLDSNAALVERLLARMSQVAARSAAFAPQLRQAREALKSALRRKLTEESVSAEQAAAIAKVLDDAAVAIDGI